jgi:hypothetical protein
MLNKSKMAGSLKEETVKVYIYTYSNMRTENMTWIHSCIKTYKAK